MRDDMFSSIRVRIAL